MNRRTFLVSTCAAALAPAMGPIRLEDVPHTEFMVVPRDGAGLLHWGWERPGNTRFIVRFIETFADWNPGTDPLADAAWNAPGSA